MTSDSDLRKAAYERNRRWYRRNLEEQRERKRKYYWENKEAVNAQKREKHKRDPEIARRKGWMRFFGMTPQDYAAMLAKQNGGCAICKSPSPKRKNSKVLAVDHCHKTGAIRGLLCAPCNMALGLFEDNFESLVAAAKYLQAAHKII